MIHPHDNDDGDLILYIESVAWKCNVALVACAVYDNDNAGLKFSVNKESIGVRSETIFVPLRSSVHFKVVNLHYIVATEVAQRVTCHE